LYIYNAIKAEFNLGKTVESSVKGGYKKTLANVIDVYVVLVLGALALLIGGAGLQTIAFQALICVIAAAFINLVWARVINYIFLSASKNKYKYFRFVREDEDDE
jgi:preprotein translocase subunit SecD